MKQETRAEFGQSRLQIWCEGYEIQGAASAQQWGMEEWKENQKMTERKEQEGKLFGKNEGAREVSITDEVTEQTGAHEQCVDQLVHGCVYKRFYCPLLCSEAAC
jgi:hypothetical protein